MTFRLRRKERDFPPPVGASGRCRLPFPSLRGGPIVSGRLCEAPRVGQGSSVGAQHAALPLVMLEVRLWRTEASGEGHRLNPRRGTACRALCSHYSATSILIAGATGNRPPLCCHAGGHKWWPKHLVGWSKSFHSRKSGNPEALLLRFSHPNLIILRKADG